MKNKKITSVTLSDGKVVPVRYATEPISKDAMKMRSVAGAMTIYARNELFSHGLPVIIGENGKVIELYPDGTKKIIG